jgi:hypothetical protein
MTFTLPLFLIAVLAGSLPVLLHMIHRQKATEIPFSTLRFLRLSVQRTRRRKFIEDLGLLAVRVAILVLIAVALANPIVTNLTMLWQTGRTTAVAIILDNSASMGTIDGGRPRLETARKAAEQVLDFMREGDALAFFATNGPPAAEHGKLYRTHETVRQAVLQCRVSYERADLAGRLQQARDLLAQSDLPNREIYIITDNQALSWEGLKEGTEADADTPVLVINVNQDPQPNVALRGVRLETPAPAVGVPITAAVELVNTADIPQARNVELYVDGRKETSSPTLNLSPGANLRHEFRFSLDRAGIHRGEVRLAEEDGCPQDNRRFFVVAVDEQISVAILIAKRHTLALADDSFYLERVLAPTGGEGWSIRPQVVTVENLGDEPLARHAAVYCVNVPALEPALAHKLQEYVQAGGHLVWICGDNVQPDAYNRMNEQAGNNLLPSSVGPLREAGQESWKIVSLDKDHPALRGLTEPASLYQSVLVHKHFPLTPIPGQQARVLAQVEGNQPLLVERSLGGGSILILGTAAQVDWTNLPVRPLFLPLMARLTFGFAGIDSERSQTIAGAPLLIPLLRAASAGELEVTNPGGDMVRIPVAKTEGRFFRFADTYAIGTYLFRWLNTKEAKPFAYAVNPDPDEHDVATLSEEELSKRLGRQAIVYCDNPQDVSSFIRRLREGQSLWEFFLAVVLLCLVIEAYMANCRGRKPAQASVASSRRTAASPVSRL